MDDKIDQIEILTEIITDNHDELSNGYHWVPRHEGDSVSDQAFVAGYNDHHLPLYIGRCNGDNHGLVVGKIDEYFYYAFGGQREYKDCVDHEILTCG